ncbi:MULTISPECIES: diguanylate cyclase [Exiguobacterium]|uniref:GGDEF domain-containing protein n=1 Tax=Exiguobacterium antarcticum TaxID=132920 RepID=A0ABT6R271_9BACL|nr:MULTISPECIES: GGDEF domain-containing protein [Exiguobacterium]AFS71757.1 Diguanylate cyclase [Exiguobacterium antarcticum B7]MCT4779227.1 GGDEF domain-containing protein [Exiguobacterium soli]MDI3235040.1 GGDEF domain-containing protein [Exiguobacterium antarcticum]
MVYYQKVARTGWLVLCLVVIILTFTLWMYPTLLDFPLSFGNAAYLLALIILFQFDNVRRGGIYYTFQEGIILFIFLNYGLLPSILLSQIGILIFQFFSHKQEIRLKRFLYLYPINVLFDLFYLACPSLVYLALGGPIGTGFTYSEALVPFSGYLATVLTVSYVQCRFVNRVLFLRYDWTRLVRLQTLVYGISMLSAFLGIWFYDENPLIAASVSTLILFLFKRLLQQRGMTLEAMENAKRFDDAKEHLLISRFEREAIDSLLLDLPHLLDFSEGWISIQQQRKQVIYNIRTKTIIDVLPLFHSLSAEQLQTPIIHGLRFDWGKDIQIALPVDRHSMLAIPSITSEDVDVSIVLFHQVADAYDETNADELARLLRIFCRVLHRSQETYQLYAESRTDALTELANSRAFYEEGAHQFAADHYPLSIILFDIDHFKYVNDTYGHKVGDLVLRELGRRILSLQQKQPAMFAARYGGEEFVLLIHHCPQNQAIDLAEQVRHAVLDRPFVVEGHRLSITISLGVDTVNQPYERSFEESLRQADHALYVGGKHNGRNCTAHYANL